MKNHMTMQKQSWGQQLKTYEAEGRVVNPGNVNLSAVSANSDDDDVAVKETNTASAIDQNKKYIDELTPQFPHSHG